MRAANVWAVSNATGGNLFELSPSGLPLACAQGTTFAKSTGMAIDTASNVWVGSTTLQNLYKYNAGTVTNYALPTAATYGTGTQFVAI